MISRLKNRPLPWGRQTACKHSRSFQRQGNKGNIYTQYCQLETLSRVRATSGHSCPRAPRLPLEVVSTIIVLILVAGGCSPPPTKTSPMEVGVLVGGLDASASGDSTVQCDEVVAQIERLLALPGVKRLDVALYQMGDTETGGEPRVLVPFTRFSPRARLFMDAAKRQAERQTWMNAIVAQCRGRLIRTKTSPIFQAISRAVESIAAHCTELSRQKEVCSQKALFISSDLRESAEPAIALRLAPVKPRVRPPVLPTLPTINIEGLTVTMCGVANYHVGKGGEESSAGVVLGVWRRVLVPSMPPVDASCPLPIGVQPTLSVKKGDVR